MPYLSSRSQNNNQQLALAVGASLAVVVLTSQIKPVRRVLDSICGRLYLKWILKKQSVKDTAVVTAIYIHPVKSCKAVSVDSAVVGSKGLVGDRHFMLVTPAPTPLWGSFGPDDATHRFLTQRTCPSLTQIHVKDDGSKFTFTCPTLLPGKTVTISKQPNSKKNGDDAPIYKATLWGDIVKVQDMGDEISNFLSAIVNQDEQVPPEYKQQPVRLVVQCPDDTRSAKEKYVPGYARITWTGQTPPTSLVDEYPILIASEESLDELNQRLKQKGKDPLPMSRFRPNIVIKGLSKGFAEDNMKVFKINNTIFHSVKGCPRCKQSCTDQETGNVTEEPLETLAEFRALNRMNKEDVYFAQNVLVGVGSEGQTIKVGDPVQVLKWGEPVWDD